MDNAFTKIGSWQYSSEAIIIKGKLEAEGLEVFMADNFTIDTDPLVSNAIGGVKIFVRTEDLPKARQILADISRYSLDDNGQEIVCENCSSTVTDMVTSVTDWKALLAFIFSFGLFGTLPFYTKYKYRCNSCGHEFNIT
jgi:DNA-directed RNA polymerase subunit RPC12/RpoP